MVASPPPPSRYKVMLQHTFHVPLEWTADVNEEVCASMGATLRVSSFQEGNSCVDVVVEGSAEAVQYVAETIKAAH
jgi:hypothetical protein